MSLTVLEPRYTWHGTPEKRTATRRIILHHAAAQRCTAQDIHAWHLANGWCGIGYHFLVRRDGSVYRGRAEDTVGAHAYGANADSLGICFEGDFQQDTMPDPQLQAGRALIDTLRRRYGITQVLPHRDVGSTDCPGRLFPLAALTQQHTAAEVSAPAVPSAAAAQVSLRQLAENHRGRDVEAMQALLALRGHPCGKSGADGIFGPDTAAAVKTFQRASGLTADGICGRQSWTALLTK